jgi:hypothetical protein
MPVSTATKPYDGAERGDGRPQVGRDHQDSDQQDGARGAGADGLIRAGD